MKGVELYDPPSFEEAMQIDMIRSMRKDRLKMMESIHKEQKAAKKAIKDDEDDEE